MASEPHAPSEERTAHHVRRLHASIRDLHNALGVYAKTDRPPRPPRHVISSDTPAADDPRSRIVANKDRGAVQHIERLDEIGAVVLGLEGIGSLVAETLCRYGVQRLVLGDTADRALGDLDFMGCYLSDVGITRERHVAAIAQRLDPELHVFALGLPLSNTALVVESLRAMLARPEPKTKSDGNDQDDDDDDSDNDENNASSNDSSSSGDESDGADLSDDDAFASRGPGQRRHRGATRHAQQQQQHQSDDDDELCFSVVFLCGVFPELAMALNELCCEFGVQLVYVSLGRDGLSGDALAVSPGRSACLQCLEKRKMLKISGIPHALEGGGDGSNTSSGNGDSALAYSIGLPTTECVLAGIAIQQAYAHLLHAGPICSRVEYDGFREELDRSGFVAPVHLCPSAPCRQQQQHHHHQRPPPTASTASTSTTASTPPSRSG